MPKPKKTEPLRRDSDEDRWYDETRRLAALAMCKWMKADMDLSRKFKSLSPREADGMAEAVMVVYAQRLATRPAVKPLDPMEWMI